MVSVYALKPWFQSMLRPFVTRLHRAGVSANQVTVFTCFASILLGVLLCFEPAKWMLALPAFLIARMALNAADGMLAREFGQKSDLGAYLNELGDVLADVFLYLPFAFQPGLSPFWIGVVIVLGVISEMSGVLAIMVGAARRYDGPMGKSDRAAVFGIAAIWIGLGFRIAPWVSYGFPAVLSVMLVITIFNRVRNGLSETRSI